jgi:valyl-tRNA synthetase
MERSGVEPWAPERLEAYQPEGSASSFAVPLEDRWIFSRLNHCAERANRSIEQYRYHEAAQELWEFFWHEFCDWYLELTKAVLTAPDADPALKRGAQTTLVDVLSALLKLLHPLMPFVTEELWLETAKQRGISSPTLMLERFPETKEFAADAAAEDEIAWLKGFVVGIRQIRGEANLPRSTALTVRLADASALDRGRVATHDRHLQKLAGLASIEILEPGANVRGAAIALLGGMRMLVPLAGLIDVAAERERLGKQLGKTRDEIDKARRKLSNQNFVANAPPEIVAKENARIADFEQRASQLDAQIARLADLSS